MSHDRKIIAVVGATGAQGGGLARAILAEKEGAFQLRAITRKPDSDKARELAGQGAEVVAADLDDLSTLSNAFKGAHGAFCMTNFGEHVSPEKETAQGRNLAQASKDAGVAHAIWSTFEDTRRRVPLADDRMPTLKRKYKVPHFDGKGEADGFFLQLGVPTTFLLTSFYWDNFIRAGLGPKRGADGKLALVFPLGDKKLPGIAVEDIGQSAYAIFKRGPELIGKTVGIAGDHLTGFQMATAMSQALEQQIGYQAVTPEVYRGFGFPGADDLANMFQYKRDFETEYCQARDLTFARSLHPGMQTFATWLVKNRRRIPLE